MPDDVIRGEVQLDGVQAALAELKALRAELVKLQATHVEAKAEFQIKGGDEARAEVDSLSKAVDAANAKIIEANKRLTAAFRSSASERAVARAEEVKSEGTSAAEINRIMAESAAAKKQRLAESIAADKAEQESAGKTADAVEKAEKRKQRAKQETRTQVELTAEAEKLATIQAAQAAAAQAAAANARPTRLSPQELEALHQKLNAPAIPPASVRPANYDPVENANAIARAQGRMPAAPVEMSEASVRKLANQVAAEVKKIEGRVIPPTAAPLSSSMVEQAASGLAPVHPSAVTPRGASDPTPAEMERHRTRMSEKSAQEQLALVQKARADAQLAAQAYDDETYEQYQKRLSGERKTFWNDVRQQTVSPAASMNTPYYDKATNYRFSEPPAMSSQGTIEAEYKRRMTDSPPLNLRSGTQINKWVAQRNQDAARWRTQALKELDKQAEVTLGDIIQEGTARMIAQDMEISQAFKDMGVANVLGQAHGPMSGGPAAGERADRPASMHKRARIAGPQFSAPDNLNILGRATAYAAENPGTTAKELTEKYRVDYNTAQKILGIGQAADLAEATPPQTGASIAAAKKPPTNKQLATIEENRAKREAELATVRQADADKITQIVEQAKANLENRKDIFDAISKQKADSKSLLDSLRGKSAQATAAFNADPRDASLQAQANLARRELERQKSVDANLSREYVASQQAYTGARAYMGDVKKEYAEQIKEMRGGGGSGPRPIAGTVSHQVVAKDTDDAIEQLGRMAANVDNLKRIGTRLNVRVETENGFKSEEELTRIGNALRQITGEKGRAVITVSAVGADKTLAQMEAINKAAEANAKQNVSVNYNTSGSSDAATLAAEARAARRQEMVYRSAVTQSNRIGRFGQRMDKQRASEELAEAKEIARLEKEAAKVQQDADDAIEAAYRKRLQPFSQTANTQSRSILGVPAALAAPVALGAGVGIGVGASVDYQTLKTTTANQTNLTTAEIGTLDQSLRNVPSGKASLDELATGFKNITDLGYSAADSQKIFYDESRAATAAGADQASVMLAITSSMKDYNAAADDVAKYTNTTVEAARLANSSFQTWSETTRRATAIAAAYGVPLQEVDSLIVALTRHGFNTAQANTQIAGLIQNIVAPTPAAQKKIDALSEQTGIPLNVDFTQQGLQAKGFEQVLTDIGNATRGDEGLIKGLIPALRGGQAALILSTVASKDFKEALTLLGQTVDGSLKPVDEGFSRIQDTTGYKFGMFLKQLRFDAIDTGAAFLPMANAILGAFDKIPSSMQRTIIQFTGMALAAKTVAVGYDFVAAAAARFVASTAAEAVATGAATTALNAQNVALTQNIALQGAANATATAGVAATGAGAAGGAAATVAGTVAVDATAVTLATGFMPSLARGMQAAVTLAGPILIGVGVIAGITHFVLDPIANKMINDEIDKQLNRADPSAGKTSTGLPKTGNTAVDNINDNVNLANQLDPNDALQRQQLQEIGRSLENTKQAYQQKIKDYKPSAMTQAASLLGVDDAQLNILKEIERKSEDAIASVALKLKPPKDDSPFIEDAIKPELSPEEEDSLRQHYEELTKKRDELIAKGANSALVNHVLFPDDFKQSDDQLKQRKADLAEWERQYNEVQKAANEARTALSGIDITKGIPAFAGSADTLKKINDQLAKFNSTTPSISGLASIAMKFKELEDNEKKASAAFTGYMLTLDETDRRASVVENFKSRVEAQVTRSQEAVDRGTATQEDIDFLKQAPDILANLNGSLEDIRRNGIPDLIGGAKNLPNLKQADDLGRSLVNIFGGGKQLVLDVSAKTETAQHEMETLINGPWTAYVDVITRDKTNLSQYSPNGPLGTGPGAIPEAGVSFPTPYNAGTYSGPGTSSQGSRTGGDVNRFRTYTPITQTEYDAIVPANSPMAGEQARNDLNEAARKGGVDPRYLLAYAAQEGNFSTAPGTEWQVRDLNPGGLKWAHQAGAVSGSPIPANEGKGTYASFQSYGDYFDAMIDTLQAQPGWQHGDPGEVAGDWTKGPRGYDALTEQGQAAVANSKLDYYRKYLQMQQAVDPSGGGGHGDYGPYGGPGAYTGQGIGSAIYGVANSLYGNAPAGAAQQTSGATWFNPLGTAPYTITQRPFNAYTHGDLGAYDLAVPSGTPLYASATGKVVESGFSKDGYGNSEVIDYGNGVQARYAHLSQLEAKVGDIVRAGEEVGKSGNTGHSDGPHLHFEVTVNGKEVDPKSIGFNFDDPKNMGSSGTLPHGTTYGSSERGQASGAAAAGQPTIGTVDTSRPADPRFKTPSFLDIGNLGRVLASYERQLDGPAQQRLNQGVSSFGQYAKTTYENMPEFFGNKTAADNQANRATLNFAVAYAKALGDAKNNADALPADFEKLRQVSGPVADSAINMVKAQQQINMATEENLKAQEQIKNINYEIFDTQQKRAAADRITAAAQLQYSRQIENEDLVRARDKRADDRRIQDARDRVDAGFRIGQRTLQTATYTENDRFIPIQRQGEDAQRALQFSQQVQATALQNQLTDTQKAQQDAIYQRTSREQVLFGQAKTAPSDRIASGYSAALSLLHEDDLLQKDKNTKAIDDINAQIRAEQKKANLDSYNLQTWITTQQRAHEDELHRIDVASRALAVLQENESVRRQAEDKWRQRSYEDETVRIEYVRLLRKRSDEDAAIALQTARAVEDEANAKRINDLQKIIDNNSEVIQQWQDFQSQMDGIVSSWRDVATYAGAAADDLGIVIPKLPGITAQAVPKRAMGGRIDSFAIVGDGPQGQILPTTEIVHAPGMDVTPLARFLTSVAPANAGTAVQSAAAPIVMPLSVTVTDFSDTEAALRAEFEKKIVELRAWAESKNVRYNRSVGR